MQASTTMGGMTMAFPNVCLVPAAPSPIPTPFPSIGQCANATNTTVRVKIGNKQVLHVQSKVIRTSGDEAGTNGGVTSGTFSDQCQRTQSSMKVNVEGNPIVTNLQMIRSNGAAANAPMGNQLAPSQVQVLVLG